jgi:restriction endonuclease S subunit
MAKLTSKDIRKLPRNKKKIITFFLTLDEALEFNYMLKMNSVTTQEYLRNFVLKQIKSTN